MRQHLGRQLVGSPGAGHDGDRIRHAEAPGVDQRGAPALALDIAGTR